MATFDRLPAKVRGALRESVFEMAPEDFEPMPESMALSFIRDIDREVRQADRCAKGGGHRVGVKAAADRAEQRGVA